LFKSTASARLIGYALFASGGTNVFSYGDAASLFALPSWLPSQNEMTCSLPVGLYSSS